MRVYISGQISGLDYSEVETEFRKGMNDVIGMGHEAVSPLANGLPKSASWSEHMVKDIEILMGCEAIYMLPNWKQSRGARIELNIAEEMGLVVLDKSDEFTNLRVTEIKKAIQSETGISFKELLKRCNKPNIAEAKTLFVGIVDISENYSTSVIGQMINRDHVTVMHHLKKYHNYMETNKDFRQLSENIIKKLPWL